jgi:hypothetical protein
VPHKRWTREQDLAVLYVKLAHKGQLTSTHPAIGLLARAMNRTEASIWMRKGNFDSLDPSVPGAGLNHPAKLTVDIWAEYERKPERVSAEARRAYLNLKQQSGT